MELISVVIPVYNVEKYIGRCLESIITNSYQNLEIICVNDGSTDDSLNILQEYALRDERIKVISKQNSGLCAARNDGLYSLTGDYVAFIDSDDWIHPQYFETLYTMANDSQADIVIGRHIKVSDLSPSSSNIDLMTCSYTKLSIKDYFKDIDVKYYVWGKLYRRELLDDISFCEDVRFAEDVIFNAEIWYKNPSATVVMVDATIYYYYQHPSSVVHTTKYRNRVAAFQQLAQIIEQWDTTNPFYEQYLFEIIKQMLSLRYHSWVFREDKETKTTCNSIILDCLQQAKRKKMNNLLRYQILYLMPFLYRRWRLINDPTMRTWEKDVRRRTAAKNSDI